jgi:hypothetical protein
MDFRINPNTNATYRDGPILWHGDQAHWSLAQATSNDTRWALFTDFRGVALCEPVNDGLVLFSYTRPAVEEKKHIITRKVITRARKAEEVNQVWFNPKYYNPDEYYASSFSIPKPPYVFDPTQVYMRENRWGPVKVLAFFTKDVGRELQYQFRRIHPDGMIFGTTGKWSGTPPHPMTTHLIAEAIGFSDIKGVAPPF